MPFTTAEAASKRIETMTDWKKVAVNLSEKEAKAYQLMVFYRGLFWIAATVNVGLILFEVLK